MVNLGKFKEIRVHFYGPAEEGDVKVPKNSWDRKVELGSRSTACVSVTMLRKDWRTYWGSKEQQEKRNF